MNNSEQFRLECELRSMLAMHPRRLIEYFAGVKKQRGERAMLILKQQYEKAKDDREKVRQDLRA